jgi:hypothetical protein
MLGAVQGLLFTEGTQPLRLFSGLGVIAALKRIAVALEEANRIARERDFPEAPKTKPFSIHRPTVDEWNESHGGKYK